MAKIWLLGGLLLVAALLLAGCCGCNLPSTKTAFITGVEGKNTGTEVSNGGTTTDRVQSVYGTVQNPSGADASTFGGKVVLEMNGEKQYVTPVKSSNGTWTFRGDLVIRRGTNNLVVRVEDSSGNTVSESDPFVIIGNLPQRKIEVVLTWNTDDNDVDMHVFSPSNKHAWYSSLGGIPGCNLDLDDTDGYGPETFVCENATVESGQWTVKVRYYSTHGVETPVTATVRVRLNEGSTQTYTHTFTEDQANRDNADNDWTVLTFSTS